MLTYKQFCVLNALITSGNPLSQRELAKKIKISLGTVNKIIKELIELKLICNNQPTILGLNIMENYRVKRAVFMAAGFGSRMIPVTLKVPKPLVKVKNKMIIEGLLNAILEADITEIYVVRGYLADQFNQLLEKYPMIKFIENPIYNESNNISSAFVAREYINNAYLLDADLLIKKTDLISKYQYRTNYLGVHTNYTDDWCFEVEGDLITDISIGGENCYKWIGLSYWSTEDGKKLSEHIKQAILFPGGKERFWDQVALEYFKKDYKIYIRECSEEDIIEIDSFNELKEIDNSYADYF